VSRLARWLFVLAFAYAIAGQVWRIDDYPPFMDFDAATLGIFVDNLSYQPRYDHYFATAAAFQDRYRALWAAFALPLALPLSAVQRLLAIPDYGVDRLLHVTAIVLGLVGSLCAALLTRSRGKDAWADVAFVVGLTAVLPSYLLYVRTASVQFLSSFALFWAAVLFGVEYARRGRRRDVYALAIVLAAYQLVPYAPLAYLPGILVAILVGVGATRRTLGDPHAYAAAALALGAPLAVRYALGVHYEGSYRAYAEKVSAFLALRGSHAFALDGLSWSRVGEKLTKLVDQHVLFRRDDLGDRSRVDDLWTLNAVHLAWLALLPVAARGLWKGVAVRDQATLVSALVLATTYAASLTIGAPEGRYLLTAVPCYAVLVGFGIRSVLAHAERRRIALALVLIVTATNTFWLLGGPYETRMIAAWRNRAGMRETMAAVRDERTPSEEALLEWPDLQYEDWLYLQMLANFRVTAVDALRMLNLVQEQPSTAGPRALFIVRDAAARPEINGWRLRGFAIAHEIADPLTGRRLVVLVKHVASSGG